MESDVRNQETNMADAFGNEGLQRKKDNDALGVKKDTGM